MRRDIHDPAICRAITLEWLQKTLNGRDAAVVLSKKY